MVEHQSKSVKLGFNKRRERSGESSDNTALSKELKTNVGLLFLINLPVTHGTGN
jgi:hypothetical protein